MPPEPDKNISLRERVVALGQTINAGIFWCGGMAVMFGQALVRGPRRPLGLFDISYQILQLGIRSIPQSLLAATREFIRTAL